MGVVDLIVAIFGFLLFISRSTLFAWPEAVRTFFNKQFARKSQSLFNVVALILFVCAAYVVYILLQFTSVSIILASIFMFVLLICAVLAIHSDIWKQYIQIFLRKPTQWIKWHAAAAALLGLLILLYAINRI